MGKGGFGVVYAGIRNSDGLHVALKHVSKAKISEYGQVRMNHPSHCVETVLRSLPKRVPEISGKQRSTFFPLYYLRVLVDLIVFSSFLSKSQMMDNTS